MVQERLRNNGRHAAKRRCRRRNMRASAAYFNRATKSRHLSIVYLQVTFATIGDDSIDAPLGGRVPSRRSHQCVTERKRYAANTDRCTAPCRIVVRPDASVSVLTTSVSASRTVSMPLDAERKRTARRNEYRGDGWNREPDAGKRGTERQVEACLQPIGAGRACGGHAFGQEHEAVLARVRRRGKHGPGGDRRGERPTGQRVRRFVHLFFSFVRQSGSRTRRRCAKRVHACSSVQ